METLSTPLVEDINDEIAALVRRLHETQQRLLELTGGEVDAVIHPGGQSYLLHEAQEGLQRSEAVQRQLAETQMAILNALPAHIALVDSQGVIVSMNDAWRLFSMATVLQGPKFGMGQNYLEVCERAVGKGSQEAQAAAVGIRRVLRGEAADFVMEYPCHSSVEQHWHRLAVTPVCQDRQAGAVVMHVDITEAKRAEGQLLWKTALFEAQVHSAPDGILVVDQEGKKILQNQRMIDLWNIPPEFAEESSHRRRLEWLTSQVKERGQFAEKVAHLYAHPDEVNRSEIELVNGKVFDRYSAPVRGKDGKYYGRIWTYRDITERKLSEEQIAEQAEFLDKARDAILVRDLEGNILFWNKGAERLYGWTHREVIGRNIDEFLYADPHKLEEANGLAISQGEWNGELQHLTKNHREIVVEARWTLIQDHEGHPKSVLAINTDITEKKKVEAQFMRAQRMESIGTLAGGIAHDLNNILTPILMSIEVLKEASDNPATRSLLETIEVSALRGADVVRQVLSFARGLEGKRVEVQPKHLLKELEKIIKDTFPKDIRMQFSVPTDTWTILGDPTQVHQILLNLCVNARDAMPHGGKLTIGVENCMLDEHYAAMQMQAKAGRYVNISVTDSGTGMPPDLIDKIFEPFFTTKEINKGTGLGLSTVMAIVKSHGGIINVYSEAGNGTTFKVYLPAMENSSDARKDPSEQVGLPRGNNETILVVDDEETILAVISQTLLTFGYQVLTAVNGADAVAVYAQHQGEIALVLTDMMMPVMDGAAAIHALTRINPAIKIIAASGLMANGGAAKISETSVKHFLTKPYTAGTLLNALRSTLDGA